MSLKDNTYNDKNLSRSDINKYQTSNDGLEKNAIEKKSLQSDFDQDALDGWGDTKTPLSSMQRLDKKFKLKTNFLWLGATALIICFCIGMFFINSPEIKEVKPITTTHPIVADSKEKEEDQEELPIHIVQMEEIASSQQVTSQTIQNDFKNNIVLNDNFEPFLIEEKKAIPINDDVPNKEILKTTFHAKEISYYQLKLVDYTIYRDKPEITIEQLILTGTSADKANKETANSETEFKHVNIPYIDYLKKTVHLFSKGNSKRALARFETILKHYPSDVNANFYGGLCYYNLGQYEKAKQCLLICRNNTYTNFGEEAEWYYFKSLKANNETVKATALFKKIQEKGGFYANSTY